MLVKNKIVEQIADEQEKEAVYYDLDNDVIYGIAYKEIPRKRNVIPCGDCFLIRKPYEEQFASCEGRLMSLYDYLPYMKDEAEHYKNRTREEFAELFKFMEKQYDPSDVYDFLMKGLQENTLHNIEEYNAIDAVDDEENDCRIVINDVYEKGQWKHYSCAIFGSTRKGRAMLYPFKRDINRAMRFFKNRLNAGEREIFNKLKLCKEMEAE